MDQDPSPSLLPTPFQDTFLPIPHDSFMNSPDISISTVTCQTDTLA